VTRVLRPHVLTLDALVAIVAALVSLSTAGLPRMLALLALASSLVLMGARSGGFRRAYAWLSRDRRRFALPVAGVAIVVLAIALANAPAPPERLPFESPALGHLPAETRKCLERPEVEAYLRDLHEALMGAWTQPPELPAAQQVVIEFTLLPSGAVLRPRVVASSHPGMGSSALEALSRAAPFEALHPEVECLSGAPVRLSLSNPLEE
jgi:hypothetical protein